MLLFMLRLGFCSVGNEKKKTAKLSLEELEYRDSGWNIHGGVYYMGSSRLGLNGLCHNSTGTLGYGSLPDGFDDTRHDLRVLPEFMDWMDSRMLQADALADDMKTMLAIRSECGLALYGRAARSIRKSFSERAVMVLYGIDIKRHSEALVSNDWDMQASTGDIGRVVRDVRSGDFDAVMPRLEQFSRDWRSIRAAERRALDLGSREGATVSFLGFVENRIASQELLDRYLAETCGRAAYAVAEAICRSSRERPVELPDVECGDLDGGVAFGILEFCRNINDAGYDGIMRSRFSALDGAALLAWFKSGMAGREQAVSVMSGRGFGL